jgi:N-hydroxyarylamine O-acetyltransferase
MHLAAYLARIGVDAPGAPSLATLGALHRAHATSIPFENLDIQLGHPVRLDLEAIESKLVDARRGGYCFEHNTLAQHALEAIGFDVAACEARVRPDTSTGAARTHMVLVVEIDGAPWLWDTGFGGDTPLEPVPFDGREMHQGGASYRMSAEVDLWALEMKARGQWERLYAFRQQPCQPVDFEVANWYTSTHPASHFVRTLTVQQRTAVGARVLRNLTYSTAAGGESTERTIARADLLPFIRGVFGIDLADDARFRTLDV